MTASCWFDEELELSVSGNAPEATLLMLITPTMANMKLLVSGSVVGLIDEGAATPSNNSTPLL